jgi:hypothetical protein
VDPQMLLALDRDNAGRGPPVSEEQLAALPHHSYTSDHFSARSMALVKPNSCIPWLKRGKCPCGAFC